MLFRLKLVMEGQCHPISSVRKCVTMPLLNTRQFGGAATVVAGLLLVTGCRSTAVQSHDSQNSGPTGIPFYRSYDRSSRPRPAESYESPELHPIPPTEIPPVPGYSEPPVPPAPSAQKSRWSPLSGKVSALTRNSSQVNQTGAKSASLGGPEKLGDPRSTVVGTRSVRKSLTEEIVRPRGAAADVHLDLSAAEPMEEEEVTTTIISSSDTRQNSIQPRLEPPMQPSFGTRSGTTQSWPSAKRSTRLNHRPAVLDGNEPVLGAPTMSDQNPELNGNVPHLLPPSG